MTDERKAEIRARLANITPAPWIVSDTSIVSDELEKCIAVIESDGGYEETSERRAGNAAFIAHAPQDIADLLAEVDRLRAYIRNAPELADTCVFDALGEVCEACRCQRNPAFNQPTL